MLDYCSRSSNYIYIIIIQNVVPVLQYKSIMLMNFHFFFNPTHGRKIKLIQLLCTGEINWFNFIYSKNNFILIIRMPIRHNSQKENSTFYNLIFTDIVVSRINLLFAN